MKYFRIPLLGISILAVVVFFQNCSNQEVVFSSIEPPICRDMKSVEVMPKLLYGWDYKNSSNPEYNQVMSAPSVGDLDGDKIPEILFTAFANQDYRTDAILRVIDGKTGKIKFSVSDPELRPFSTTTPLIIDIDRDGKPEIVYIHSTQQKVIALNHNGSLKWSLDADIGNSSQGVNCMAGFAAADLDGDGKAEIIADKYIISEDRFGKPFVKSIISSTTMGAACQTYAISLENKPSAPYYIISMSGVHKTDGSSLWNYTTPGYSSVADVDPQSPGLEVVVVGDGFLTIYNGLSGNTLARKELKNYEDMPCDYGWSNGVVGGGQATIGDFDGDSSTVEIAIATGKALTIFNSKAERIASSKTQDCTSLMTGLTSFDFNGDKKPEIIYADEQYLRIYEMDGSDKLKVVWETINPNGTLVEYPIVADVNNDGYAELVVVSNNNWVNQETTPGNTWLNYSAEERSVAQHITGVRVFAPNSQKAWMPTRPLWNQYSYFSSNVGDSLNATKSSYISNLVSTIFKRNIQQGLTEQSCIKQ